MMQFKGIKKEAHGVSLASVRKKLYSAVAMLVVSGILMVNASYAWFVMSTAPEVSNIKTQVGANGALEIALLNTESWNDLSMLDMGDIDESQEADATNNLSWGNLVNLEDSAYGLMNIKLMPARLNISMSGTDDAGNIQYKVGEVLLKTPKYGEDGRIQSLEQKAVSAVFQDNMFPTTGTQTYGVRAIGTSANMSGYQLAINAARNAIVTQMAAARTAASNILNSTGTGIANIATKYALQNHTTGYTVADVTALRDMAVGLQSALTEIETALRQVYAAYIVSAGYTRPAQWDYEAALNEVQTASLSQLNTKYPNTGVENMSTYISKLASNQTTVSNSISECNTLINANRTYSWTEISNAMRPLVDYDRMTMGGKTMDEIKAMKESGDLSVIVNLVATTGLTLNVPSGSGILSDIADYAGNYTAKVEIEQISYGDIHMEHVNATMATATTQNPVYLTLCGRGMGQMEAAEAEAGASITDFFGYALDLAFRTNAVSGADGVGASHLLLQTEPENRVYAGSEENADLQGGGSYMAFQTQSGISATKMIKLMKAVRVVFVDKDKNILRIGALNTALGKNSYKVLTNEEKSATGMHAVLDGTKTGIAEQNSDYIDQETYTRLPDEADAVEFDTENQTVKARLYLYDFEMTKSETSTETETKYTGGITMKTVRADASITELTENTAKAVTVLVYLDGSFVNNSMVAANTEYSMTGVLNLQFASDAELVPAEITALRSGQSTDSGDETP